MDAETLVTLLVVALVMVVLIFLLRAADAGRRRPQLRPSRPARKMTGPADETQVKPGRREVA